MVVRRVGLAVVLACCLAGCTRLGYANHPAADQSTDDLAAPDGADDARVGDATSDGDTRAGDTTRDLTDKPPDAAADAPVGCGIHCTINVDSSTHDCTDPHITKNTLASGRGRFSVDFGQCTTLTLRLRFCDATGFSLDIGNSPSNDAYGGDTGLFSNDSELYVVNQALYVSANDYNPGTVLQTLATYLPASGCVDHTITIRDGQVSGTGGLSVQSPYVFRLNQPDKEGKPDAIIYLGLDRVVNETSDRLGSGLVSVDLSLQ